MLIGTGNDNKYNAHVDTLGFVTSLPWYSPPDLSDRLTNDNKYSAHVDTLGFVTHCHGTPRLTYLIGFLPDISAGPQRTCRDMVPALEHCDVIYTRSVVREDVRRCAGF